MWEVRERVGEGVMRDGYAFKYDISVPLTSFYEVVGVLRERLTSPNVKRINGFGHLGKPRHARDCRVACSSSSRPVALIDDEPFCNYCNVDWLLSLCGSQLNGSLVGHPA